MTGENITAAVFDIQRFSVSDGPGIRTTVFLKGCPLRCAWCHNPEAFTSSPQIRFTEQFCHDCGMCKAACDRGNTKGEAGANGCAVCGKCIDECPFEALRLAGRKYSLDEITEITKKDEIEKTICVPYDKTYIISKMYCNKNIEIPPNNARIDLA